MPVLAIITMNPEPDLDAVLQQQYAGKFYRWSPTLVAVATTDTPATVGGKIGVMKRGDDGVLTGQFDNTFVVQFSPSYWGYGPTAFWEWLKTSFEATA